MGKTPLFRTVSRLLQLAQSANEEGLENIEQRLSRRQFLAGATAVSLLATRARAQVVFPKITSSLSDVIIVGGGIAGLTTAYRLRQSGISSEIFEASSRVGGRMWTKNNFNSDGMYVDLGAELVDSDNADLIALCQELNVPLGSFAAADAGLQTEIYFANGKVRSESEIISAFQPLATLLEADIAKISPSGVLTVPTYNNTISSDVVALDQTSLYEYLYSKSNQVESYLLDIINNAFVGEYGLDTKEQSALNLLVLISPDTSQGLKMFGVSDEVMRILGGSGALPAALEKQLQSQISINLDSRLIAISDKGSSLRLVFSTPGGIVEKDASRVVMTVPFSVLREVEGISSLGLSPAKSKSIANLGYGTNAKLMMGFKSRFWRSEDAGVPASRGVIFSDLNTQEFWETSRLQVGDSGILTSFTGGASGEEVGPRALRKTLDGLNQIYSNAGAQFDGNHVHKVWKQSPFQKGSYTCPMPGQYTSFIGSEGEPELQGRLLFAGEHCSLDFQGFMNGSVETANAAAFAIAQNSTKTKSL